MISKKIGLTLTLLLMTMLLVSGCSTTDKLLWKNDDADRRAVQMEKAKQGEVTPAGLKGDMDTPLTPEKDHRTSVSRPQVVTVEEKSKPGMGKKYFDVVDDRKRTSLAPRVDKAAMPVRTITLDDNSQSKDFNMRFGVVWERMMEAMLQTPLLSVDRSSGILVTDWTADTESNGSFQVRYKYTIRVMDRGAGTRIRVIPFLQVLKGGSWISGRPSLIVSKRMFYRIEQELKTPVPSMRQ